MPSGPASRYSLREKIVTADCSPLLLLLSFLSTGYDEGGAAAPYKAISAAEYIDSPKAIELLGMYGSLTFDDDDSKTLLSHESTSAEILELCKDLRVLGKKDFKALIKWRTTILKSRKSEEKDTGKSAGK